MPDRNDARRLADSGIYSDLPEINARIIDILPDLPKSGFTFRDARPIPYGTRLTIGRDDSEFHCNLYFSKKKGYSCTVDKKTPAATAKTISRIMLKQTGFTAISSRETEQGFTRWIGSDEAGKGDYFGPLVVCAFMMTRDLVDPLRDLGVKDSKSLTDETVRKIARTVFTRYNDRVSVVELVPETYNRLYEDFRRQGKKLNALLAWAHGKAIASLADTTPVDAVIVDQFASAHFIQRRMNPAWHMIIRHRAEDNIAVAAASIMARSRYLYRLEKLSEQFDAPLSSGSGDHTLPILRKIAAQHGQDALRHVAKLHFKNTEKAGIAP